MIQRVEVRNFQSIEHIDLDLGPLTVIVGSSSAGKSAFTRSLKHLVGNTRGTNFIRHGETTSVVTAVTDRGTVTLKRGKGDEYIVIPASPEVPQRSWTKLEGRTPEEVTEFIGIEPKDPINFAGQFDMPYMLDDTGNAVARALGALTGVNIIFEAAGEARRAQLAAGRGLKDRQGSLTDTMSQVDAYRPLKAQRAAQDAAEEHLALAVEAQERWLALNAAVTEREVAAETLRSVDSIADAELPSKEALGSIIDLLARIKNLDDLVVALRTAAKTIRAADEDIGLASTYIIEAQQAYIDVLTEAGTCPTCGQSTKHLEAAHG